MNSKICNNDDHPTEIPANKSTALTMNEPTDSIFPYPKGKWVGVPTLEATLTVASVKKSANISEME